MKLSRAYWRAVQVSLAFQIALGLVAVTSADGHELLQVWSLTMAAYWAGVVVIFCRRPHTPTNLDLLLVRWGFPPLFALFVPLSR